MRFLILLVFVSAALSSKAQVDYFANNPEWLENRICYDGQGTSETWDYVYYLNGDSTINGTVWHALYKRGSYFSSGLGGSGGYTYNNRIKFIRQDGLKLYTLENGASEMLLYDFDLNVGDTLPWTNYHWSLTTVVDSIQMITINGTQRKKMFVSDVSYGTIAGYVIEGVGTQRGLFETVNNTLNCGNQLVCFSVNNTTELGSNCNFSVGLEDFINKEQISIQPNPVSSSSTLIVPDQFKIKNVQIIDASGKEVRVEFLNNPTNLLELDFSNFSNGVYIIEIQIDNEQVVRKKVIKY